LRRRERCRRTRSRMNKKTILKGKEIERGAGGTIRYIKVARCVVKRGAKKHSGRYVRKNGKSWLEERKKMIGIPLGWLHVET